MINTFAIKLLKQSSQRFQARYNETDITLNFNLRFGIMKYDIIINKITGVVIVVSNEKPLILKKNLEDLIRIDINRNPFKIIIEEYLNLSDEKERRNGKSKFKSFFKNISKKVLNAQG